MSPTEILVLVGGLVLGYWVVSKLFDDLNRDRKPPAPEQSSPRNEPAANGNPAEPGASRKADEGNTAATKDSKP